MALREFHFDFQILNISLSKESCKLNAAYWKLFGAF